jgi:WD40 repeat protein
VAIWNTKTGIVEFVLKGHTNEVWSVAWSPDGQQLATGETLPRVPMIEAVMLATMVIATANVTMVAMIVLSMATFVRVTKDNVSLC